MFNLGRSLTVDLEALSVSTGLKSPEVVISALGDVPEAKDGTDTQTMHFSIKTHLGWIPWKERESSLYHLFERSFAATRYTKTKQMRTQILGNACRSKFKVGRIRDGS